MAGFFRAEVRAAPLPRHAEAAADMASGSRYRQPRLRAGRYVRVVRPVARAVVPVARSGVIRVVIRDDRPEPEPEPEPVIEVASFEVASLEVASLEVASLEVASLEVASLEAASLEAAVLASSTAATAPEMVTATVCRLAGRVDRHHDRQCGDRHECDLFSTCKPLHAEASLLLPRFVMATASGRFTRGPPLYRDRQSRSQTVSRIRLFTHSEVCTRSGTRLAAGSARSGHRAALPQSWPIPGFPAMHVTRHSRSDHERNRGE